MIHWAWLILAFMVGGGMGLLTLALVSANRFSTIWTDGESF